MMDRSLGAVGDSIILFKQTHRHSDSDEELKKASKNRLNYFPPNQICFYWMYKVKESSLLQTQGVLVRLSRSGVVINCLELTTHCKDKFFKF